MSSIHIHNICYSLSWHDGENIFILMVMLTLFYNWTMIYVCSDIHGCFSEFKCLLETVDFKDEDTMYILGDVLDRGEEPIALLQHVMSKDNIVLLKGIHEYDAFLL